jgi:oxalate decarboxylase/phosphoglucose isomerase-like protein (cupin superfamily)
MHPKVHGNQAQSLAEATVPSGTRTHLHRHFKTEEIYHVTEGSGLMTMGAQQFPVEPGDTVLIPPGTPHCIEALGTDRCAFCVAARRRMTTLILNCSSCRSRRRSNEPLRGQGISELLTSRKMLVLTAGR